MPQEPRSHGNVSAERRRALLLIGGTAVAIAASGGGCATGDSLLSSRHGELADAANLTKPCWDTADYERFVRLLPDDQLRMLYISVGLATTESPAPATLDREETIRNINQEAVRNSSGLFDVVIGDGRLRYDRTVRRTAGKLDVPDVVVDTRPTFQVEQAIGVKMLEIMWDQINLEQRLTLLKRLDPHQSELKDHEVAARFSGSAAAAALSATTLFNGFAFYPTMSVAISSVAEFSGRSPSLADVATGSAIGAFILGLPGGSMLMTLAVGFAWSKYFTMDVRKTAIFIFQVNVLRAMAWKDANRAFP